MLKIYVDLTHPMIQFISIMTMDKSTIVELGLPTN